MKIPVKYKEKYEKLEMVRRALGVKTRQEVAEEFNMPYETVLGIAKYFELNVTDVTRKRRYQKVLERLESAKTISRTALFMGLCLTLDEKREALEQIGKERPELIKKILRRNVSNSPMFVRKRNRIAKMKEIIKRGGRMTLQEIGNELGVTREMVSQYSKELGLKFDHGSITKRTESNSPKKSRKVSASVKTRKSKLAGKRKRK